MPIVPDAGNVVVKQPLRVGVSASLLFRWHRLIEECGLKGLGAEEGVVPESDCKQLKAQVRDLQRPLGKKMTRLINRELVASRSSTVNYKRVYRDMREHQLLLQRCGGQASIPLRWRTCAPWGG